MQNTKHTPGPWSYTSRGDIIGGGITIALVASSSVTVSKEAEKANARLIAAAPELLAELERAEFILSSPVLVGMADCVGELTAIRAVIAKAKGV